MKFKRIFSAILILLMSAAICLSPVLIYSENGTFSSDSSTVRTNKEDNSDEEDNSDTNSDVKSDKKTNDDDDRESGTIRGSKPTSTPAAKSSKSASSKATATPEPKAEPTKNPRVGDGGKPILAEQEAAILVNCLNGEVMFEQNSDKQIYPASTTKIMTALLTLEAIDRGEINLNSAFLITPDMLEDLPADGSSMQLKEGEAMTVQYLLEGLMVESGNDAAQALAVIVCGDVPTFVERMNNKAEELGLSGTH
ncbi:D-alanyl-D-alanine carboxypeptidase family protein, partial [Monoglobus pectinilyticus]